MGQGRVNAPAGAADRAPTPSTADQRRRTAWIVAALLVLTVVGGTVGAMLFVRAANRTRLDPGLLAVAPLAVGIAGFDSAGPAIVQTLTRRLGESGTVRPVPPAATLEAWDDRAAPAEAAVRLAQRTGAAWVVLAQLWAQGSDSVRLVARLLDVGNNQVRSLYEIRALRTTAPANLGDSLAHLIGPDLGGQEGGGRGRSSRPR
jgi:hypothetical protein